jgi:uncharacterized OB-fold protein
MSDLAPDITPLNEPYWKALEDGQLKYQHCRACGHAWLPARAECPSCLRADWAWQNACGQAKLVSWVVFHHAYHPSFKARIPYIVAIVELAEGPRLVSGIVGDGPLRIDMPMMLLIERTEGIAVPKFAPA